MTLTSSLMKRLKMLCVHYLIEEKIESLRLSEADPVYYTQEEMRKAVASWRNL